MRELFSRALTPAKLGILFVKDRESLRDYVPTTFSFASVDEPCHALPVFLGRIISTGFADCRLLEQWKPSGPTWSDLIPIVLVGLTRFAINNALHFSLGTEQPGPACSENQNIESVRNSVMMRV